MCVCVCVRVLRVCVRVCACAYLGETIVAQTLELCSVDEDGEQEGQ